MMPLRRPALLGLGILVVLLSSCGSKSPEEQIVGKWRLKSMGGVSLPAQAGEVIVEYKADNTAVTTAMGMTIESTYEFIDESHIKSSSTGTVQGMDLSQLGPQEAKVEIDGDTMVMGDDEGLVEVELERVK